MLRITQLLGFNVIEGEPGVLSPSLLVNPNTFFPPFVGRFVLPSLLVNPNTIYPPRLAIQPPRLSNPNTFFPPVVQAARATWDAASAHNVALSGSNLVATNTGTTSSDQGARVVSAMESTGKFYFEFTLTTHNAGFNYMFGAALAAATYGGIGGAGTGGVVCNFDGHMFDNGTDLASSQGLVMDAFAAGDVCGVAVDMTNNRIYFRRVSGTPLAWWNNGSSFNSHQDPALNNGTIVPPAGALAPICTFGGTSGVAGSAITANFGQSAFVGAVPSGFTSGWPAS
jgi:hypothetical protein